MNVSRSGCNRSVLNDCGHILDQCEQDSGLVINECEQKTALLSITAVYVIDPLQITVIGPPQMRPATFLQFRPIDLNPTPDTTRVDFQAAL